MRLTSALLLLSASLVSAQPDDRDSAKQSYEADSQASEAAGQGWPLASPVSPEQPLSDISSKILGAAKITAEETAEGGAVPQELRKKTNAGSITGHSVLENLKNNLLRDRDLGSSPDRPMNRGKDLHRGSGSGSSTGSGLPPNQRVGEVLQEVTKQAPDQPVFRAAYGEYLYNADQPAQAYEELSRALDLGDKSPETRYLRGAAAEQLGDHERAHADAAAVLKRTPNDQRAQSLLKLTDGRISAVHLSPDAKALSGSREDGERGEGGAAPGARAGKPAYVDPIEIARKENAAVSKDAYAQSSELAKEAATALRVKGYGEAVRLADKALALDPENAQAYHMRATAFMHQRRYEEAADDASKALELSRGSVATLNTRALAYNRLGRYPQAFDDASQALLRSPRSAFAYYNRAYARAGMRQKKESLDELKRAALLDRSFTPKYREALGLPAEADLTLVFADAPEAGAQADRRAPEGRGLPGWPLYLSLAAGGVALLAFGLRRAAGSGLTTARRAEPAAAAPPPTDVSPGGTLLGRYRVEREIASGGMGVVYEAVDEGLRRRVAIKRMRGEIRLDMRERERFLAEARTVAKLRHPNIVEIFSIEEAGEDAYLVFEYVEGRTLQDMLRDKGRLSLAQAQDILRGACAALDYAHEAGVVHRDLKPANILVDGSGTVKVTDFGVARESQEALTRLAVTNTVCGTPAYMSPEQEEGLVGRESDVYALGVCLYQLLTGRLPFEGSPAAMLLRKRSGEYPKASSLASGFPAAVDAVIDKALHPDPGKRFRSARELHEALNLAAAGRA